MHRTALVTGACGFIGSHLVDQLRSDGWEVRATDLAQASRRWLPRDVDWIPSDLTRPGTLTAPLQGIDTAFHVAAVFDFSAPWERLYRANVLGTENLLKACCNAGVRRVVSWSSYDVYGKFDRTRLPIEENHPVAPKDPYGRSKAMQDAVVWRYHDQGLPVTILRPSAPYGPRARHGVAELFRRLNRMPLVPVPRSLTNRVMSVHVLDVARAASFLADSPEAAGEQVNVTDDGNFPTWEFISFVAEALGKKSVPVWVPGSLLTAAAWALAYGSLGLARLLKVRPWLEKDTVTYLTYDFRPSNAKLKSLGFQLSYPDPRTGIPGTIAELRREGYLT